MQVYTWGVCIPHGSAVCIRGASNPVVAGRGGASRPHCSSDFEGEICKMRSS